MKISLTSCLCLVWDTVKWNTHICVIKRKLHVGLNIWRFISCGKKISLVRWAHSWKINFICSRHHVISSKYLEGLFLKYNWDFENYFETMSTLYLQWSIFLNLMIHFRSKLRGFLEWSSVYRVSLLLSKIKEDSDLDAESAILYGKVSSVQFILFAFINHSTKLHIITIHIWQAVQEAI